MRQKFDDHSDYYLSQTAIDQLKIELERLQRNRPKAVEEVTRTQAMGDLSENAGYQTAKAKLRGMDSRIFEIKEQLKHAIVIKPGTSNGKIRIGSVAIVEIDGIKKTFEITGSHETDPAAGRISHLSPLGASLLGHGVGDSITVRAGNGETTYQVVEIR